MTECTGPVRGVLSIGGDNPFGEAPFEIKDSLSIFEAARIASGRHPAPRFLEGEDMATYWRLIAAGSDRQDWRRVRPQRSISMFRAIMDAIEQDKIIPVTLIYLIKPAPGTKGALDWRFTRIKTIDVERLCWNLLRPTEALAGEPRENSLPTIPAAEPLAIGAPAGGEAPADTASVEQCLRESTLPESPEKPSPGEASPPVLSADVDTKINDFLRSSGLTNMDVAWPLVQAKFGVKQKRFRSLWTRGHFGGRPGRPINSVGNSVKI
jgi:hypothetical protein